MKRQIIAIGGGGFGRSTEDLRMEQYLLDQVEPSAPKVGFLPQATAESQVYINHFYKAFTELGAVPSWVSLFGVVKPSWREQLLAQDVIYVGGGNTRSMICLWKEWGVDEVLREAYDAGILLCGVSAGAICWFEQGVTDSVWPLGVLPCVGLLPGSCCPHYDSEPERRPSYQRMTSQSDIQSGIAFDDLCMGHYLDGSLHRVVVADDGANAWRVADGADKCVEDVERIVL